MKTNHISMYKCKYLFNVFVQFRHAKYILQISQMPIQFYIVQIMQRLTK